MSELEEGHRPVAPPPEKYMKSKSEIDPRHYTGKGEKVKTLEEIRNENTRIATETFGKLPDVDE